MDISFYTAGAGARAQQTRLDIIGNNMANANTPGYKSQKAGFVDLLYSNVREPETTDTQMKVGCGTRVEKTDTDFNNAGVQMTDDPTDYAIVGKGFFAVQDPANGRIYYTRDGNFRYSQRQDGKFYLVTEGGNLVLDKDFQSIEVDLSGADPELNNPGIFDFRIKDGMILEGDNLFSPVPKNGAPVLREDSTLQRGYLEMSNAEVSVEFVRMIETQRAYSMNLKMIQTSNEIEQTIEGLRG